jgi:hypothetical protein
MSQLSEERYRVILKDAAVRAADAGPLREGGFVWVFGIPGSVPMLWKVSQVLPAVHEGEGGEIVVELWTGEPPRLA